MKSRKHLFCLHRWVINRSPVTNPLRTFFFSLESSSGWKIEKISPSHQVRAIGSILHFLIEPETFMVISIFVTVRSSGTIFLCEFLIFINVGGGVIINKICMNLKVLEQYWKHFQNVSKSFKFLKLKCLVKSEFRKLTTSLFGSGV